MILYWVRAVLGVPGPRKSYFGSGWSPSMLVWFQNFAAYLFFDYFARAFGLAQVFGLASRQAQATDFILSV